jgi:hypothetical protein
MDRSVLDELPRTPVDAAEEMRETPAEEAAAPPSPPARPENDHGEDYSYRTIMSSFRL